mgnify:FL=1|jgi:protein LSM12
MFSIFLYFCLNHGRTRVRIDNIGENVSAEAQEIFDALARTLPCRWKEQVIVVLEEVTIAPPYVEPKGGDDLFRDRIKNVLVHERRRLGI